MTLYMYISLKYCIFLFVMKSDKICFVKDRHNSSIVLSMDKLVLTKIM